MSILEKKFVKSPDILMEKESDGALLFNRESGEIKILNPTGAFIYEKIDGVNTGYDIIKIIRENFEIPDEIDIIADIEELFNMMKSSDLFALEAEDD